MNWRRLACCAPARRPTQVFSPGRGVTLDGLCLVGQPGGTADRGARLGGELLGPPCQGVAEKPGRSEYRFIAPTELPCALSGIDSEERTPRASARTAYSHHR